MSIPLPTDLNQMAARMKLYDKVYTDGLFKYWYEEATDSFYFSELASDTKSKLEWADVSIDRIKEFQ